MKNLLSHLAGAAIAFSLCISGAAQDYPELETFMNSAQGLSTLYRGKQALKYPGPYNGNEYWASKKFETGDILFEGKLYRGVSINIDAAAQEALVRPGGHVVSVALPADMVDYLTMDGVKFVNLHKKYQALPSGFYEVLYAGKNSVYKRVMKRMNSSVESVNGSPIGYDDPYYRNDVFEYFEYKADYYFQDEAGKISKIRRKRDLIRKFPDKKRAIRRYANETGISGSSTSYDVYCQQVLKFAEQ